MKRPLQVLAVIGSLSRASSIRTALLHIGDQMSALGARVDVLDFHKHPLSLFNPDTSHADPAFPALKERVDAADVLLLGTPDYHGCMSSTMKSFLDHFWDEFAGRLFVTVVASHEKGLTVADQLRTVARQCYAWSMPYGVSFNEKEDLQQDEIASVALKNRLEMLANDACVYGQLLAAQREADLAASRPGFLARYRQKRQG